MSCRLLTRSAVAKMLALRAGTAWDLCRRAGLVVSVGSAERVIEGDLEAAIRSGALAAGAQKPARRTKRRGRKAPTWADVA